MKKNITLTLAFVFAMALSAGCSQRVGEFTLLSTKNVDLGEKFVMMSRQTGCDSRMDILTIPIGIPDMKQAVDNCIDAGKGQILTNAVIDFKQWTAFVYGQRSYTVTGDVWGKPSVGDLLTNPNTELFELQSGAFGYQLVSTTNPEHVFKVSHFASR